MYKLVIFDVDGTLVEPKSGATFRKNADDWQWLPGRLEKLQQLQREGVHLGIASNQGGVAFGYMEAADINNELQRMADEVPIHSSMVSICVQHPKASIEMYRIESDRRKPGPGMIRELMGFVDVAPEETLFVGDRPEDEGAAKAAGVSFQWANEFFN